MHRILFFSPETPDEDRQVVVDWVSHMPGVLAIEPRTARRLAIACRRGIAPGGSGTFRFNVGGISRVGEGFASRIWRHDGYRWRVLASMPVGVGSGRIRFECIGMSLTLYLDGTRVAVARDAAIAAAGGVGVRFVGDGARVDRSAFAVPAK